MVTATVMYMKSLSRKLFFFLQTNTSSAISPTILRARQITPGTPNASAACLVKATVILLQSLLFDILACDSTKNGLTHNVSVSCDHNHA